MRRRSVRLVCAAFVVSSAVSGAAGSGCSLAHDHEGDSSHNALAGTEQERDQQAEAPTDREPTPRASAGRGADPEPNGASAPGDVTASGGVQSSGGITVSADAGVAVEACEQVAGVALGAAAPVTTLDTTLHGAGDPTSDSLLSVGEAVAIDGDTLAFSALRNSSSIDHGSVFVYVRSGDSWVKQAELVPPTDQPDSWFGQTLALSGDTLAVAAPEEFFGAPAGHGSIHVFTRSDGQWSLQQTLTAEQPTDRDGFGRSMALDGDRLAIATHLGTVGHVEIFERDGAGFQRVDALHPEHLPETQTEYDWVGPVVLDGDVLAVTVSPGVYDPAQRVEVYEHRDGVWERTARLVGDHMPEAYGLALALQGSTLLVGDSYFGTQTNIGDEPTGGVYVFERNCDASWTQRGLLTSGSEFYGGNFGGLVALDGARILVGEPSDPSSARGIDGSEVTGRIRDFDDDYTGAVHVFGRVGDGYERLSFLKPGLDAPRETYFGMGLAASGGVVVVGARGEDAVYVLR